MGHGCDLPCASGGVISQVAGCDLTDAGVRRDRCDLGLCAVVRSGVVCAISPALLSLRNLGFGSFFFFFFWKWFEGKLGDGFWTVGRHDLGWLELG